MKVIPKKTFLLRQDTIARGKKKDVIATKGVKLEVTDQEAAAFFGNFIFEETDKKKLIEYSKVNTSLKRIL